jgi:hypothetical protein
MVNRNRRRSESETLSRSLFRRRQIQRSSGLGAAYVGPSQIDEIEPREDTISPYREAALDHLRVLLTIDEFMTVSENPRLAWITVAITFDLISIRGLTPGRNCHATRRDDGDAKPVYG